MHLYKSKKVKSHYTSCRNGPINPIKRDKVNKGKSLARAYQWPRKLQGKKPQNCFGHGMKANRT